MMETLVGWHAVTALIQRSPPRVKRLWVVDSIAPAKLDQLQRTGIALHVMPKEQFLKTVRFDEGVAHQGVACEAEASQILPEGALVEHLTTAQPLVLALDGVTDPRNLGAILRTAEAAGVSVVIQPKDNAAPLNGAARKTACGAAELVPLVQVTNLKRTLEKLRKEGYWVSGAAGEEGAVPMHQADFSGARVLVMGSEGRGLRKSVREACDQLVAIPMLGAVSSLNVSVATGVLLYQAVSQRG
ncbi:MAG: 23S rRNA (guanosine(2251)-2'-O)-methyltransferase RlmB [Litorivicinus sp.]